MKVRPSVSRANSAECIKVTEKLDQPTFCPTPIPYQQEVAKRLRFTPLPALFQLFLKIGSNLSVALHQGSFEGLHLRIEVILNQERMSEFVVKIWKMQQKIFFA